MSWITLLIPILRWIADAWLKDGQLKDSFVKFIEANEDSVKLTADLRKDAERQKNELEKEKKQVTVVQ